MLASDANEALECTNLDRSGQNNGLKSFLKGYFFFRHYFSIQTGAFGVPCRLQKSFICGGVGKLSPGSLSAMLASDANEALE